MGRYATHPRLGTRTTHNLRDTRSVRQSRDWTDVDSHLTEKIDENTPLRLIPRI